jgi:ribosome-associated translation inhibitor RaiA
MSSKKSEKNGKPERSDDKKDKSAMAQINDIEKAIKNLSASLNKLKTKFKTKSESTKKD